MGKIENAAVFGIIHGMPDMATNEIPLVQEKTPFKDKKWKLVGGKREENESIEEALIREIEEEIGIRVAVGQEIFRLNLRNHAFIVFKVKYVSGETKLNSEIDLLQPCNPEEIADMIKNGEILRNHAYALSKIF